MKGAFGAAVVALLLGATAAAASVPRAPGSSSSAVAAEAKLDARLRATLGTVAAGETVTAIVTLREQTDVGAVVRGAGNRRLRLGRLISALRTRSDVSQRALRTLLAARRAQGRVTRITYLWIFNGIAVTATPDVIAELAARPEVLSVRLDEPVELARGTTTLVAAEANIDAINAPAVWDRGFRGQGIVVASLDTGVDVSHPDLTDRWRGGSNSWFDPNGQHATPFDADGHGTQTMGLMVGGDGGGTAIGVAPDAKWIAVKIFDDGGSATAADIHQGYQWLLDPDQNPDTADAPHVVNNSWSFGTPGCDLEFQLDLQALRAARILPVFAGGNYGPGGSTSVSPANYPEALAVGTVGNDDAIASNSSRGPSSCGESETTYPDVVAPGAGVRSTDRFSTYGVSSGTSIAAPHVAGSLALLLDAFSDLTAIEQEAALELAAVDLGDAGPDDTFGYGRIDVDASFSWLAARRAPDFTLTVTPASAPALPGGSAAYTVAVGSLNAFMGDVALSVDGLPSGAVASFTPAAVVPGGEGSAQLTVDVPSSAAAGTYPLTVTGSSGAISHMAATELVVADFTINVSPSSASVTQGGAAQYDVTISPLNGFADAVDLSADGLPSGANGSFNPPSISGGSGTSTLTVTTSASTPGADYPIAITGTSGPLAHTAGATLGVVVLNTTTAFPTQVVVNTGKLLGGNAASLNADDAAYVSVNSTTSGTRTTAWTGRIGGVPNTLKSLLITYKGKNSLSCNQVVQVQNQTTGTWVTLDARSVGATEVLLADLAPPSGTPPDFVTGTSGNGQVRVRVMCTGSGNFVASGNLMKVAYGMAGPPPPPPPGGTTTTLIPVDDAYVRSNYPTENTGSATTVRVYKSGSTETHAYLKFVVPSLPGAVTHARLRLMVNRSSSAGGTLYAVADTGWQEETITWSTKPGAGASPLATIGPVTSGTWIEVDLTGAIAASTTYSFVLKDGSSAAVWYLSKEGASPPELVIRTG